MKRPINFSVIFLAVAAIVWTASCTKVDSTPTFPIEPSIRLIEINQLEVMEFQDTLEILLAYEDGDGDLGNLDPDIPGLVIKDARLSQPDSFHLQPLAPYGAQVSIQGELLVRLPQLFLLGNGSSESTRFKVKLLDRAGHESNEIETPQIKIIR
jgi:hypothetical protein